MPAHSATNSIYHHVSGTSLAHAKTKNENLNVYSGRLNFRFSVSKLHERSTI